MDWWTPQQAGLIGGLLGGGLGGVLMGAIGGGVCGPLAGAGKARGFVLGYFAVMGLIGLLLILTSVAALVMGQPFHVWFWLFMPGLVVASLAFMLRPSVKKVYLQHEQRTLAAEELRRS